MNILFWMDHPSTFNPKKDTTYLLIHECIARGYNTFYITDIGITGDSLIINAQKIIKFNLNDPIELEKQSIALSHDNIDTIWIRKDPPVDENYTMNLLILQQFKDTLTILNDPLGVLTTNEKLAATHFYNLTPKTLISQNNKSLIQFINQHESCILKPLNGFGGQGILKITKNDTNLQPILEMSTNNFTKQIVCQQAVDHHGGDKRIILLNQTAVGAINRVNPTGHRNNFMSGGHAEPASITKKDQIIIEKINPFLKNKGLFFVGIDIIDNYLIEINVTSPTGIQEINQFNNLNLERQIINAMEKIKESKNA